MVAIFTIVYIFLVCCGVTSFDVASGWVASTRRCIYSSALLKRTRLIEAISLFVRILAIVIVGRGWGRRRNGTPIYRI